MGQGGGGGGVWSYGMQAAASAGDKRERGLFGTLGGLGSFFFGRGLFARMLSRRQVVSLVTHQKNTVQKAQG